MADDPAQPWPTQPPYRPGQPLEDQITDAVAWEFRKRMAVGPTVPYNTVARVCARVALRTIERDRQYREDPERTP